VSTKKARGKPRKNIINENKDNNDKDPEPEKVIEKPETKKRGGRRAKNKIDDTSEIIDTNGIIIPEEKLLTKNITINEEENKSEIQYESETELEPETPKRNTKGKRKATSTIEATSIKKKKEAEDINSINIKSNVPENSESLNKNEKKNTKSKKTIIACETSSSSCSSSNLVDSSTNEVSDSPMMFKKPTALRKSITSKPRVIFTGMSDKAMEKMVKEMGGEVVDNISKATLLVTDKVRRTVKFLCALSRGIPIVGPEWLKAVKTSKVFSNAKDYILNDSAAEKQYRFNLKRSLEKACETPLLSRYEVFVTKNVKPEPKAMKEIIECAGGKYLAKQPRVPDEKIIIISCSDDTKVYEKFLEKEFCVCNNEILLTGILRQQLDIQQYSISNANITAVLDETHTSQPTESKRKRRK